LIRNTIGLDLKLSVRPQMTVFCSTLKLLTRQDNDLYISSISLNISSLEIAPRELSMWIQKRTMTARFSLQSSTNESGNTVKANDESFVATVNSMVTVLGIRSSYPGVVRRSFEGLWLYDGRLNVYKYHGE
jgi:hypothetical protein